jgi:peptidoglycan/xylan/chitin deacetylase (PgdA/CDA1 family)
MSNEIIVKGNPNISNIALTFDNGPGRATPYIIDMLRKYGAKATFFALAAVLRKTLLFKIIQANT